MKRMGSSNVLVVGLKGLGVEIGKFNLSGYRPDPLILIALF
jgi:hypothetical protein